MLGDLGSEEGMLACLSSQSLNTLADTLSNAESLSAVIACVHRDLGNTGDSGSGSESRQPEQEVTSEFVMNDAADIPLHVFEPSKRKA
jgi:hypothetical protein